MDFLIATHNNKKRDELQRILSPLGITVLTADEAGVDLTDVEETGTTFEENALLKARSGAKESNMPCIADDSGLCVDALDGAPGVYSARFAGEHGNDPKNNQKLLDLLKDVPPERRTARFVSAVACVFPDGRELTVRGTCEVKTALATTRCFTETNAPLLNFPPPKKTQFPTAATPCAPLQRNCRNICNFRYAQILI